MLAEKTERTAQIKIEVEPRLHRQVKACAALRGETITQYVTGLLEERAERVLLQDKPEADGK